MTTALTRKSYVVMEDNRHIATTQVKKLAAEATCGLLILGIAALTAYSFAQMV